MPAANPAFDDTRWDDGPSVRPVSPAGGNLQIPRIAYAEPDDPENDNDPNPEPSPGGQLRQLAGNFAHREAGALAGDAAAMAGRAAGQLAIRGGAMLLAATSEIWVPLLIIAGAILALFLIVAATEEDGSSPANPDEAGSLESDLETEFPRTTPGSSVAPGGGDGGTAISSLPAEKRAALAAIGAAATKAGIDPALMQSLCAAESNLSSSATSTAGAGGICQIDPRTWAGWQRETGRTETFAGSATDPAVNAEVGAYVFSNFLESAATEAGGHAELATILAVASYNGGHDRVVSGETVPYETAQLIARTLYNQTYYAQGMAPPALSSDELRTLTTETWAKVESTYLGHDTPRPLVK